MIWYNRFVLKRLFAVATLVLILLFPAITFAALEFSTAYTTTYDVNSDGTTQVTQKITLKNLTNQYYASNFTLIIGAISISEIAASDDSGALEVKTDTKEGKSVLSIELNRQIAGIDKEQTFILKYKSADLAQKSGKVWEINLPKIPNGEEVEKYDLVLSVPLSFGDLAKVYPTPNSQSQDLSKLYLSYSLEQLKQGGISAHFGTSLVLDFVIRHKLKNNALFSAITSVVIPPDTNYQNVIIKNIEPKPANVTIDDNGNYLAWYKLPRKSNQEIVIQGSAKLHLSNDNKTKNIPTLSNKELYENTKDDKDWPKSNPAIKAKLLEIFKNREPKTNSEKAKIIHKYIAESFRFSSKRLSGEETRLGVLTVLNNPDSALSLEFTDLFITLARAAGVPARGISGYGLSQNQNLKPVLLSKSSLHFWPEYYDERKGWVMIDPTWENTTGGVNYFDKFDLSHLSLVKNGTFSEVLSTGETAVQLTLEDLAGKPNVGVEINVPEVIWTGLPSQVEIKVSNTGNMLMNAQTLRLNHSKINILGQNLISSDGKSLLVKQASCCTINLGSIPPFGHTTIKFNLRSPLTLGEYSDNLEVEVANQKYTKKIIVKNLVFYKFFPVIFIGLVVIVICVYAFTLGIHFCLNQKSTSVTRKRKPEKNLKSTHK